MLHAAQPLGAPDALLTVWGAELRVMARHDNCTGIQVTRDSNRRAALIFPHNHSSSTQPHNTMHTMRIKAFTAYWAVKTSSAFILVAPLVLSAGAQTPVAAPPTPAKEAIDSRKAVFTLIGGSFRPIAEILRGNAAYESVDVGKYTTRVSLLTNFLVDAFPDASKNGDTRAKPEIWSNRADFDKKLKDFHDHALALSQLAARPEGATDAFKTAARTVAQDCKRCHDDYRIK
jgi:cytochrome c556